MALLSTRGSNAPLFPRLIQFGLMYNFLIGLVLTLMAFVYILAFVKDTKEMKAIQAAEAEEKNDNEENQEKKVEKVETMDSEPEPKAEGVKGTRLKNYS